MPTAESVDISVDISSSSSLPNIMSNCCTLVPVCDQVVPHHAGVLLPRHLSQVGAGVGHTHGGGAPPPTAAPVLELDSVLGAHLITKSPLANEMSVPRLLYMRMHLAQESDNILL